MQHKIRTDLENKSTFIQVGVQKVGSAFLRHKKSKC